MWLSAHGWESSPLLAPISTVATVLTVIAGIWAAMYASRPRRALAYKATWNPPTGEQIQWVNSVLPDEEERGRAAIVTFVLRGSGRLDVATSAYDNATPITLRVKGAEIRSAHPVSTRQGGGLMPPSQVRNNKLEIGPGLIGRNQVLTFTLIAVSKNHLVPSGQAPVALTNALIDTRLRTDKRNTVIVSGVFALVAAAFLGLWYGWLRHTSIAHPRHNTLNIPITLLAAFVLRAIWQYADEYLQRLPTVVIHRITHHTSEPPENQPEPENQPQPENSPGQH